MKILMFALSTDAARPNILIGKPSMNSYDPRWITWLSNNLPFPNNLFSVYIGYLAFGVLLYNIDDK